MAWPCFWLEPTGEMELSLRRFVTDENRPCPGTPGRYSYHNAMVPIGRAPERRTPEGFFAAVPHEEFDGDARWPDACARCDYRFGADDHWQVWTDAVYRRADGAEHSGRSLPPGAMLDGFWHPRRGPDGIALVVVLPPEAEDTRSHWWHVDGPASGGGGWTRTGDPRAVPPTVDVNPSIHAGDYHGYLRHGVLTDPL